MTTMTKKSPKKRSRSPRVLRDMLPPSADIVEISGREYLIAPFDEYQEWEEDRALMAIVEERLNDGSTPISYEEFTKRLDRQNKGRKG